jgi:DNA polymerase III subunit beta
MKFSCNRADLLHGVQTSFNAISSRNTLPILSNLLLETGKDTLKFTATDLEVSINCSIPAEISSQGSITVPAKKLLDIVREFPDKEITCKVGDNNSVTLTCEKSVFKLNGLAKDEYPILPKAKKDEGVDIAQGSFQNMIKKSIFSVSTDETRYVLNGVLLIIDNDKIKMVSTDGHRLSYIENNLGKVTTQKINHIIPAKALQELNKVLNNEGNLNIQLNDNQIIFTMPQVVLMSRLIDGQFPNYDQVIPKNSDRTIIATTDQFIAATRRVSLMASDKSNSVKYTFGKNSLQITANTPEVGEAQEDIEVQNSGDNLTVAYNAKYILDVLKNLGTDSFAIELSTNLNPGVFKPQTQETDATYLCVIMPMRV